MPPNKHIETPIETYVHREIGNRIDLVGMIHVAEQPYFDRVQAFTDKRTADGALVHYEMVRRASQEELAQAPLPVQFKVERTRNSMRSMVRMFTDVGFVYQKQALTYHEDWENHDASELDIARRMGNVALGVSSLLGKGLQYIVGKMPPEDRRAFLTETIAGIIDNVDLETKQSAVAKFLSQDRDKVFLEHRNIIALKAIDTQQAIETRDLTLLWGMAHLVGIGAGLGDRGYQKVDEQKITAITINE